MSLEPCRMCGFKDPRTMNPSSKSLGPVASPDLSGQLRYTTTNLGQQGVSI